MNLFVTGVSDDLQKEFNWTMLHDNMNISHLMVHIKHVEEARTKRKSRDGKRARSFDGGSQSIGLRYKTSLGLRNGFQINFLPCSLRLVVIGCLSLSLRRKRYLFTNR